MLALAGVSHREAPLALRERLHVDAEAVRRQLRRRSDVGVHHPHAAELAVLATCNRIEVYVAGVDAPRRALAELSLLTGVGEAELAPLVATRLDRDAAAHLFAVAGGLESAVVGETQILGQVREAHRLALEAGTSGRVLGRLFRQAVQTGRRIRSETTLVGRPASVPAAAVRVAEQALGSLEQRSALVLGAGRVAELAVLELVHRRAGSILVANRTFERAERLAHRFGAAAVPFSWLEEALAEVDVVVSATAAPGLVVSAEQVARALARRGGEPLLLLDAAVPRDLDPRIAGLPGCRLYDVDDLARLVAAGREGRAAELERARAIAEAQADEFRAWQLSLRVVPAIVALRRRADEIRAGELARAEPKLAALAPGQRRLVESLTEQIVNKLLHEPTVRLKDASAGPAYAGAIQHLFGLDAEEAA